MAGTSRGELERQLGLPHLADGREHRVRGVEQPHPRDYFTQDRGEYPKAVRQHVARMEQLFAVCDQLLEVLEAVQNQGVPRG
jgi:hypothetical protein